MKKLALLIPAHNEELILAKTIRTAIQAGQSASDIFVVDDASSDKTFSIAKSLLGKQNVLKVRRSGKAIAVKKALAKFDIVKRYRWIHIADADSLFGKNYFKIYKNALTKSKAVVAVGFVQSLRGNWISDYRALSYSYGQHYIRRVQSALGMITVFPGPTTSFKTSILSSIVYESDSLTEDFDITLQVHRKKLGKVQFIPKAVNYTQDPQTLTDFCRQTDRWFKGYFQGIMSHHIGRKTQRIDWAISYQLLESFIYLAQMFVFVPIFIAKTGNWLVIPVILAADFVVMGLLAFTSSIIVRRLSIIGVLPYFYFLRWIELGIFVKTFVEVCVLKNMRKSSVGWSTQGRRYRVDLSVQKDLK